VKKTIDKLGRIVIPSELRKELGVSDGDEMKLEVKDGKLVVSKAHKKDSPEARIKELETNRDEAIEYIKDNFDYREKEDIFYNADDGYEIALKEILSILERGSNE
jgi:AbrB family looped-hinge helix DNA binding protein